VWLVARGATGAAAVNPDVAARPGFWTVFSPVWIAYTTPLATIGGSGTCMSREIHVGISDNLSPPPETSNAMMLPLGASP
jgi:hypothetical protein